MLWKHKRRKIKNKRLKQGYVYSLLSGFLLKMHWLKLNFIWQIVSSYFRITLCILRNYYNCVFLTRLSFNTARRLSVFFGKKFNKRKQWSKVWRVTRKFIIIRNSALLQWNHKVTSKQMNCWLISDQDVNGHKNMHPFHLLYRLFLFFANYPLVGTFNHPFSKGTFHLTFVSWSSSSSLLLWHSLYYSLDILLFY